MFPEEATSALDLQAMEAVDALSPQQDDMSDSDDHAGTHAHIFTPPFTPPREVPKAWAGKEGGKEEGELEHPTLRKCAAVQHMQALICQSHIQRLTSSDDESSGEVLIVGDAMKARLEEKMATVELLQKMRLRQSFYELEKSFDPAAYLVEPASKKYGHVRARKRHSVITMETDRATERPVPMAAPAAARPLKTSKARPLKTQRNLSVCVALSDDRGSTDKPDVKLEWSALKASPTATPCNMHKVGSDKPVCSTEETSEVERLDLEDPSVALKQTWKQLLAEIRIVKSTRVYQ